LSEDLLDLLAPTPGHFLIEGPEPRIKGEAKSIYKRW